MHPIKGNEVVWFGGAKLCSYPGTAALLITPLTIALAVLAFGAEEWK